MAFPLIFGLHVAGTSQNVFYICRWKACFWPISAVLKRSSESQTKWLTSISVFCSLICFLTRKSELPCDGSKGEQFILALESLNPSPRRTSFCLSRVIKIEATAFWIYLVWTSSVEHQASGEAPSRLVPLQAANPKHSQLKAVTSRGCKASCGLFLTVNKWTCS